MILYSETGQASATANLLQALLAIPRIQVMLESLHKVTDAESSMSSMLVSTVDCSSLSHSPDVGDHDGTKGDSG
jgi:hypothetical protein